MIGSSTALHNRPAAPPLAVYIHWPFCKKKCPYCDFNSHVRDAVDQEAWRNALLAELRYWQVHTENHEVTSVFFGGGTPSLMPPETAEALIEEVHKLWPVAADCEITLEANPTSVEARNFEALRAAGVNRVSLGVQSLNDASLAFLGREHRAGEALDAVRLAQHTFPRFSFDLIYALPGQTVAAWEEELREALAYADGHLSLYQLTIEENTAFHHAYHVAKQFTLPEESLAAVLYERTQDIMEEAGLPAYEISNHARPGEASRHNCSYWRGESYLGIGPGAHGRVGAGSGRLATRAIKSPERWLQATTQHGHGLEESTPLSPAEAVEEKLLMGMRLTQEGFDAATLTASEQDHFYTPWREQHIRQLVERGLIAQEGERIVTTQRGRLLLNEVTSQLLVP